MESDIKPRISSAQHLVDEIAQIGALDRQRSAGHGPGSGETNDHMDYENETQQTQGRALPVSPPNNLAGKLLKVVVADHGAKEDLVTRLHETKLNLLDLCERQLGDLLDAAPSGSQTDIEDVDKLLAEMQTVRRCMETVVGIERVLSDT